MTGCWLRFALGAGLVLVLTACRTTNINADENKWYCEAFRPILWSSKDSAETLKQIAEHNAAWDKLCETGNFP